MEAEDHQGKSGGPEMIWTPAFGSGLLNVLNAGELVGASERDRTSDLLITNELA
jgi:hypothetical protein